MEIIECDFIVEKEYFMSEFWGYKIKGKLLWFIFVV